MAGTRRPLRTFHRWFAVAGFLLLVAVVGVFGYRVYQDLFLDNSAGEGSASAGEIRTVEIVAGLNADDVAQLLESQGIIDSSWSFTTQLEVAGAAEELKPGVYQFAVGEDYDSIIEKLREGADSALVRVTLPEGLAIDQAAARLSEEGVIDGAQYEAAANEPDRFTVPPVGNSNPEVSSLEGLLFPETYLLPPQADADLLIEEQLAAFEAQTADLPWENAEGLGITPYEALIVASLIEKEAKVAEERPLVAAVIYNRLEQDMTLGIDATIRYALQKWTEPLTQSDLAVDSPFNSRERTGLPPAPIASPGVAALRAALEPAEVDYLYYVLEDEAGHHFFTSSYEEFLQAKSRQPGQ